MPESGNLWVKLVYRTDDLRVIGAELAGHDESLAKRCDVIATAIAGGLTVVDVADLDLAYAPPYAPVWDPVLKVANKIRFSLKE
jgi:NADPH-dependent 2,4-dienoyl-CoA reductase/sulfur reductase-like enzyme